MAVVALYTTKHMLKDIKTDNHVNNIFLRSDLRIKSFSTSYTGRLFSFKESFISLAIYRKFRF